MSESFFESEGAVETQPEQGVDTAGEGAAAEEEARALTVSMDDFAALEERVLRAVALVKQERQTRAAAEERAEGAEAALREQSPRMEYM